MSSALNICFIRSGELTSGIGAVNPNDTNDELGKSKACAKEAIKKSAASRFIYTLPIFCTPILFNAMLSSVRMLPKAGPLKMMIEVLGVTAGLYIAMPLNCALFT